MHADPPSPASDALAQNALDAPGQEGRDPLAPAALDPLAPAALDPLAPAALDPLARKHLRFGWIGLLVFATLGAALELLHAFKSNAYLGVGNETRRLMWTLAHAHGVGLSLLHIGLAATLRLAFEAPSQRLLRAARCLSLATLLLPGGFFLGGIGTYGGDPGVGILLAPIGAVLLWICILFVALELSAER